MDASSGDTTQPTSWLASINGFTSLPNQARKNGHAPKGNVPVSLYAPGVTRLLLPAHALNELGHGSINTTQRYYLQPTRKICAGVQALVRERIVGA